MKLSTSNTFDVSQVADTKSYQELTEFFEYMNTFSSDIVQAFNKRITFTDNINFTQLSLNVKHGTGINIGRYNPIGVFIQSEVPYLTYKLATNADSTRQLYVYFKNTQNVLAKSAIWQAGTITRYVVQNTEVYSVGDTVKVTGFGTANNNGTFLVTEIDLDNNYLYLSNRKRTSATGDESKTGYVGSVLETFPITLGLINA